MHKGILIRPCYALLKPSGTLNKPPSGPRARDPTRAFSFETMRRLRFRLQIGTMPDGLGVLYHLTTIT